jgi:hypothetical protein
MIPIFLFSGMVMIKIISFELSIVISVLDLTKFFLMKIKTPPPPSVNLSLLIRSMQ